MDHIKVIDNRKFIGDKYYTKLMQKDEKLFWSGNIIKTNNQGRRQERLIILTNKRVINVGKQHNELFNIFSSLIKREIHLEDIKFVTYSMISNNFVLHVPKFHDYNISSSLRNQFLSKMLELKEALKHEPVGFFFVEDIDLSQYTKGEKEK